MSPPRALRRARVLSRLRRRHVVIVVLAWSQSALGQAVDAGDGEEYAAPAPETRGGFMASLSYDVGYGAIGGYPNKLGQLDNPRYYAEVSGLGAGLGLVLGGALRDWLTAGLLVRIGGVQALDEDSVVAASNVLGLRMEAYPLYAKQGPWRDLSVAGELGIGLASVVDISDSDDVVVLADGGAMSHLALGAAYSPWRFWHFAAGPEVRYTYQYSPTLSSHIATVGMRMSFFGVLPQR